jgi:aspartyl-tRNA(Asn)/glutamyl-tRNA(Gln) amidotransferase subunit B
MKEHGIPEKDAFRLVEDRNLAAYFENCLKMKVSPKLVANWMLTDLLAQLNIKGIEIDESPVTPQALAGLVQLIENNTISGKIAKEVLPAMVEAGKSAGEIVKEKGLVQVTDTKLLEEIAGKVIQANPRSAEDYRAGKKQALGRLVGEMMKETKGQANPKLVNEILERRLSSS